MKVCIVGLGYVGLPAACVLAQAGHSVVGVDVREAVVTGLNSGQVHIDELGIYDLLQNSNGFNHLLAHSVTRLPSVTFMYCCNARRAVD